MTTINRGGPQVAPAYALASQERAAQRAAIVASVRRQPCSRSDLSERLTLSSSAVSRLVHGLINDGWLIESGIESAAIGRPRTTLSLNSAAGHLISVLLGPGQIRVRIVDASGSLLVEEERRLTLPLATSDVITVLEDLIIHTAPGSPTIAVGVSAPGIVDAQGSVIEAPDLGWRSVVKLGERLGEHFQTYVTVDNDVNLMMLAEAVNGHAVGVPDSLFLYHGERGIGLGIMSNGLVLGGATGASGEIGLIPINLVDPGLPPALLEDQFSLDAIAARLRDLGIENVDDPVAALLHASAQGRDDGLLDRLILVVARALALLSLLLNPALIVIGGGLRVVLHNRIPQLRTHLAGWVPHLPRIEISKLGEQEIHLAVQTKCWDQLVQRGL